MAKYREIKQYSYGRLHKKTLKVGDNVIITQPPKSWNSHFTDSCPLSRSSGIIYPYKTKIIAIAESPNFIAMYDGVYGWSLTSLIEDNAISNLREIRRKKLKKISKNGRLFRR